MFQCLRYNLLVVQIKILGLTCRSAPGTELMVLDGAHLIADAAE